VSKKQAHGLGRGFESLIPTNLLDESLDPTQAQDEAVSELRTVKVSSIEPNPHQPRRTFEAGALRNSRVR